MFVGIDVYHSPDDKNSWCGFVSSLDKECTQWYSQVRDQRDRAREMIDVLGDCMRNAIKEYLEVRLKEA